MDGATRRRKARLESYRMKKPDIRVTVATRYLPDQSEPAAGRHAFAYTITLVNAGSVAAQLISRHWIIEDGDGQRHEVKGLGVVGQQPLLQPGERFEYTSGTPLRTATGTMQGSYFFVTEDGERFEVPVEPFALVMPRVLH